MDYGSVLTNLLDLWSQPEFNSERVNQALFGEVLKLGASRRGFVRVTQTDGYTGWADRRFVVKLSRADYHRRLRSDVSLVKSTTARVYDQQSKGVPPYFIYYGTRVTTGRAGRGLVRLDMPIDREVYVKSTHLAPIRATKQPLVVGSAIIREARRFLGVPYLWGGVSPAGFDCSGLVRAVWGRFGVSLPRDTKDQIKAGVEVQRRSIKTGDLVFFDRHVGIAIGGDRLIHASVGGGGVRENGISVGGESYRDDLDRSYCTARRLW
jgi:hypothetical protein